MGDQEKMSENIYEKMDSMIQTLVQYRCTGMTGIETKEESSWQRHTASTDGVTRDTPSTGRYTLHPGRLRSSGVHANMTRSGIPCQLLGLVLVTMSRDIVPVGDPLGEGSCTWQIRASLEYMQNLCPFPKRK